MLYMTDERNIEKCTRVLCPLYIYISQILTV